MIDSDDETTAPLVRKATHRARREALRAEHTVRVAKVLRSARETLGFTRRLVAEEIGASKSRLEQFEDPEHRASISLPYLLLLPETILARTLAPLLAPLGYELRRTDVDDDVADPKLLTQFLRKGGRLGEKLSQALEDGHYSAAEAAEVLEEIEPIKETISRIEARARSVVASGPVSLANRRSS